MLILMTDVTRIFAQIEQGDPSAAEQLLPLVHGELRRLAATKLAHERPGQTLQATALVHEAFVRLVDNNKEVRWDNRGHFFGAAAEAMRRILVERARQKQSLRHGGGHARQRLAESEITAPEAGEDILELNDALNRLEDVDHAAAKLVKLRYFAGLNSKQAAQVLGISPRTADRTWVYARSFLLRELEDR